VLSNIMSKTSDTSTYVVGTDSLEAIADGGGGAGPTAQQIREEMDANSTKLALLTHANYGLEKLVRSAAPAHALAVDAAGKVAVPDTQSVNVLTQSDIDFGALQKASLNAATVDANVVKINNVTIAGTGSVGNLWRPA